MSDGLRIERSIQLSQTEVKRIYFLTIGDGFIIEGGINNPRNIRDEVSKIQKDLVKGV